MKRLAVLVLACLAIVALAAPEDKPRLILDPINVVRAAVRNCNPDTGSHEMATP